MLGPMTTVRKEPCLGCGKPNMKGDSDPMANRWTCFGCGHIHRPLQPDTPPKAKSTGDGIVLLNTTTATGGTQQQASPSSSPKTNDRGRPDRPDLARNEGDALVAFCHLMHQKLKANRHKGGWSEDSVAYLITRLEGEVCELKEAIVRMNNLLSAYSAPGSTRSEAAKNSVRAVALEAADVANYAMMIADVVGSLRDKEEP